jgi:hypothetical protein
VSSDVNRAMALTDHCSHPRCLLASEMKACATCDCTGCTFGHLRLGPFVWGGLHFGNMTRWVRLGFPYRERFVRTVLGRTILAKRFQEDLCSEWLGGFASSDYY